MLCIPLTCIFLHAWRQLTLRLPLATEIRTSSPSPTTPQRPKKRDRRNGLTLNKLKRFAQPYTSGSTSIGDVSMDCQAVFVGHWSVVTQWTPLTGLHAYCTNPCTLPLLNYRPVPIHTRKKLIIDFIAPFCINRVKQFQTWVKNLLHRQSAARVHEQTALPNAAETSMRYINPRFTYLLFHTCLNRRRCTQDQLLLRIERDVNNLTRPQGAAENLQRTVEETQITKQQAEISSLKPWTWIEIFNGVLSRRH